MELMDRCLDQLYKLVYKKLELTIPETVVGKMAEAVSNTQHTHTTQHNLNKHTHTTLAHTHSLTDGESTSFLEGEPKRSSQR